MSEFQETVLCDYNYLFIFKLLQDGNEEDFLKLKNLSNLNNVEHEGQTLLQCATIHRLPRSIEKLLGDRGEMKSTQSFLSPIELAAQLGDYKVFEVFLRNPNVEVAADIIKHLCIDTKQTEEGIDHHKCLDMLLEKRRDIDVNTIIDNSRNTLLHYTAKFRDSEKVLDLLRLGASVASKNRHGDLPLKYMDSVTLETHLDECIEANLNNNINESNFSAVFNYTTLIARTTIRGMGLSNKEMIDLLPYKGRCMTTETRVAPFISKSHELKHLIKHPTMTSFIYLQWHRIRWFFYMNLLLYAAFCTSLFIHILMVFGKYELVNYSEIMLDVTYTLLICREIYQSIFSWKTYFLFFRNWLQLILILVTYPLFHRIKFSEMVWKQTSSIAIILAAFEMLFLIGEHPKMSTHIVMLRTVSFNFLKLLLWYSILILGFSMSFYTLFMDTSKDDNRIRPSIIQDYFLNPGLALFKTFIMLTGEYDASTINFEAFPVTSHLIFLLFVFVIAIILFNLLNGLAVSDTQLIKDNAELIGHIECISHINYIKNMLKGLIKFQFNLSRWFCIPKSLSFRISYYLIRHLTRYSITDQAILYPNQHGKISLSGIELHKHMTCYLDGETVQRTKHILSERKEALKRKQNIQELTEKRKKFTEERQQSVEELQLQLNVVLQKLEIILKHMDIQE